MKAFHHLFMLIGFSVDMSFFLSFFGLVFVIEGQW